MAFFNGLLVNVYRGKERVAELGTHAESGYILSDAAQRAYQETGSIEEAFRASSETHGQWIDIWGGEENYAQAHGAFGTELPSSFGLDKTFISVTTDPAVAARYAGANGKILMGQVPRSLLLSQTLPGSTESEFLIRHGTNLLK